MKDELAAPWSNSTSSAVETVKRHVRIAWMFAPFGTETLQDNAVNIIPLLYCHDFSLDVSKGSPEPSSLARGGSSTNSDVLMS